MRIPIVLLLLAGVARGDALEPDDLATPPPEHGRQLAIDLPAVPTFDLPAGGPSVRALRVHGAKLLDTRITITGVVTWVYDCATAIRNPGDTDRDLAKRIAEDPTLCERPRFYVGDTAKTPPEKSLWVVDVPRPYNKLELERIPKAERSAPDRCEPGAKISVCPPYRVGDAVIVTGDFKVSSPHAERNSDGLLVFASMKNATLQWQTPGSTWPEVMAGEVAPPAVPPAKPATPARAAPVAPARPMRTVVAKEARADSLASLDAGNRALGAKQLDDAAGLHTKAIARWPGNHLAWYGLGGSLAARGSWTDAADAFEHCVTLRPDVAMYQLWLGVAGYEGAVGAAREGQARKENRRPEEIAIDLSAVNFERPRQHLLAATRLDPGLWRAPYYLGKLERAGGHAREAADAFTTAIHAHVRELAPYVALGELYRKWDYTDQAIAVATQGAAIVPGDNEVSDIWYEVGMGYDDKRLDDKAIDAFTKALESRRDNHKAKFQRGQAYFRKGDFANAKKDLEDFAKSGGASVEFAKQQASKMLLDIAAKSAMQNNTPVTPEKEPSGPPPKGGAKGGNKKLSPEDMLKDAKAKKGK